MREWHATGPTGSRFERVRVRVLAYFETHRNDGKRRLVVQAMDGDRPIAEDPILEERVTNEELAEFIETSINQGWRLAPSTPT